MSAARRRCCCCCRSSSSCDPPSSSSATTTPARRRRRPPCCVHPPPAAGSSSSSSAPPHRRRRRRREPRRRTTQTTVVAIRLLVSPLALGSGAVTVSPRQCKHVSHYRVGAGGVTRRWLLGRCCPSSQLPCLIVDIVNLTHPRLAELRDHHAPNPKSAGAGVLLPRRRTAGEHL